MKKAALLSTVAYGLMLATAFPQGTGNPGTGAAPQPTGNSAAIQQNSQNTQTPGDVSVPSITPAMIGAAGSTDFRFSTPANRNPSPVDDISRGFVGGNMWNWKGFIWENFRNTKGQAGWQTLGSQPKPGDLFSNNVVSWGLCKQVGTWTGPSIAVVLGTATSTIGFGPNQCIDEGALGKAIGNGTGTVAVLYDESGNALNIVATTNTGATGCGISLGVRIGNVPAVVCDDTKGSGSDTVTVLQQYMQLSNSLVFGQNALSATMVARDETAGRVSSFMTFGASAGASGAVQVTQNQGGAYNPAFFVNASPLIVASASMPTTPAVIGFALGTATVVGFANEVVGSLGFNPIATTNYTGGWIGAGVGATPTVFGAISIAALNIYNIGLSSTAIYNQAAAYYAQFGITPQVHDPNIVIDGDSIMHGWGANQLENTATKVTQKFPFPIQMHNVATAGATIEQQFANYNSSVAPLYTPGLRNNILVIEAGLNDFILSHQTAAQTEAAMSLYVSTARKAGWTVGVTTLTYSRSLLSTDLPNWTAYNAWIRAGGSGANFIVDAQADPSFGPQAANTAGGGYYVDPSHLTPLSQDLYADLMQLAIYNQLK